MKEKLMKFFLRLLKIDPIKDLDTAHIVTDSAGDGSGNNLGGAEAAMNERSL